MKRLTKIVIFAIVASTGCSNGITETSPQTRNPSAHTREPIAASPSPAHDQASNSAPIQINLPPTPSPIPNDAGSAHAGHDEPLDHAAEFHDHGENATAPIPWPEPPTPTSPPLDIAQYVATVVNNVSPTTPLDPSLLAPWLTPSLADDFRLANPGTGPSARSVLVDTEIVNGTETAHQVLIRLLFEQTSDSGISFAHVDALVILDTESHWRVASLEATSR